MKPSTSQSTMRTTTQSTLKTTTTTILPTTTSKSSTKTISTSAATPPFLTAAAHLIPESSTTGIQSSASGHNHHYVGKTDYNGAISYVNSDFVIFLGHSIGS